MDIATGQIIIGGRRGFKNVAELSYCTAAEISDRVRDIAEARGLPESETFERADRGRARPEDTDWDPNVWRSHLWRRWVARLGSVRVTPLVTSSEMGPSSHLSV